MFWNLVRGPVCLWQKSHLSRNPMCMCIWLYGYMVIWFDLLSSVVTNISSYDPYTHTYLTFVSGYQVSMCICRRPDIYGCLSTRYLWVSVIIFCLPEGKAVAKFLIAIPVLVNLLKSLFTIHGVLRPSRTTIHSNPIHFIFFSNPLHLQSTPVILDKEFNRPKIRNLTGIIAFVFYNWSFGYYKHVENTRTDCAVMGKIVREPTFSFLGEQKHLRFAIFQKTYFSERKQAYLGRKSLYSGRKHLHLGRNFCV